MSIPDTFFTGPYMADPLVVGDALRENAPVHEVTVHGVRYWIITRFDDAAAALRDEQRFSKNSADLIRIITGQSGKSPSGMFAPHMLFRDGKDHARLRRLFLRGFTPRRIADLEDGFREATRSLVRSLPVDEPVDVIDRFAVPLPLGVICDLIGVPDDQRGELRGWVETLNENHPERAQAASGALENLFSDLIARTRDQPGDDLLSDLIHVAEDADRLSGEELMASLFLLLNAGLDTTANLIGTSIHRLLLGPRPSGWDLVAQTEPAAREKVITDVLHEANRWGSATHMATPRFTTVTVEIGGITIPADEIVLISLLSANRDPRKFGDTAHEFQIQRANAKDNHSFGGSGIHNCLGRHLGLMEGWVALDEITSAFPHARLTPGRDAQPRVSLVTHGLDKVFVDLQPPRADDHALIAGLARGQ